MATSKAAAAAAGEVAFSSSAAPIGLKLRSDKHLSRPSNVPVATFYELERIANAVLLQGARHVALQFPEALLRDATDVVWQLEAIFEDKKLSSVSECNEIPLLFVLADTSYGEASVDAVAAGHMPTDFIVHFGSSVLEGSINSACCDTAADAADSTVGDECRHRARLGEPKF